MIPVRLQWGRYNLPTTTSSPEPTTCLQHTGTARCFTGGPKEKSQLCCGEKLRWTKSDPAWHHDDFSQSWLDLMHLVLSVSTAIVCFSIQWVYSLPHMNPPKPKAADGLRKSCWSWESPHPHGSESSGFQVLQLSGSVQDTWSKRLAVGFCKSIGNRESNGWTKHCPY